MSDDDYKDLLRQAEDELGATPGAYCSRRAAVRALELLREAGQKEFSEVDERIAGHRKTIDQYANRCAKQARIIERQAQAIQRLEAEKMRGGQLGQHREIPMGEGILAKAKASRAYDSFVDSCTDNMRKALNTRLDNDRGWKQV